MLGGLVHIRREEVYPETWPPGYLITAGMPEVRTGKAGYVSWGMQAQSKEEAGLFLTVSGQGF